jgi:hypothetical protein
MPYPHNVHGPSTRTRSSHPRRSSSLNHPPNVTSHPTPATPHPHLFRGTPAQLQELTSSLERTPQLNYNTPSSLPARNNPARRLTLEGRFNALPLMTHSSHGSVVSLTSRESRSSHHTSQSAPILSGDAVIPSRLVYPHSIQGAHTSHSDPLRFRSNNIHSSQPAHNSHPSHFPPHIFPPPLPQYPNHTANVHHGGIHNHPGQHPLPARHGSSDHGVDGYTYTDHYSVPSSIPEHDFTPIHRNPPSEADLGKALRSLMFPSLLCAEHVPPVAWFRSSTHTLNGPYAGSYQQLSKVITRLTVLDAAHFFHG